MIPQKDLTDAHLRNLVRTVPPPRVVDKPTYDAIECNRCGQCCEGFTLPSPLFMFYQYSSEVVASSIWVGELEPVETGYDRIPWHKTSVYRCPRVAYGADGKATCTIHETRPLTCKNFPLGDGYGGKDHLTGGYRVVPLGGEFGLLGRDFEGCSWRVQVLDFHPWLGLDLLGLGEDPNHGPELGEMKAYVVKRA